MLCLPNCFWDNLTMKKNLLLVVAILAGSIAQAQTLLPDITPPASGKYLAINAAQQRMFVYNNGTLTNIYPVAVGKNRTKTPIGEYRIGPVAYNPTWSIPKSIQRERAASGQPAITSVPPGPNNPLGPVFIRLGEPNLGLGIHGTNAPSSVPGVRSHGCVRMKSTEALKMAKFVDRGMPASVIYQLVSVNEDEKGQLWLAAYGDPYIQKNLNREKLNASLKQWEQTKGIKLNQARIEQTLKEKKSRPVCISCTNPTGNKISGALKPLAWTEGLLTRNTPSPTAPAIEEALTPEEQATESAKNSFPWGMEGDNTGTVIEIDSDF